MIQYALGDAHVQRPAFGLEKEGDLLLNRWRTPLEKVGKLLLNRWLTNAYGAALTGATSPDRQTECKHPHRQIDSRQTRDATDKTRAHSHEADTTSALSHEPKLTGKRLTSSEA
jgi:hypothetical protein